MKIEAKSFRIREGEKVRLKNHYHSSRRALRNRGRLP